MMVGNDTHYRLRNSEKVACHVQNHWGIVNAGARTFQLIHQIFFYFQSPRQVRLHVHSAVDARKIESHSCHNFHKSRRQKSKQSSVSHGR